MLAAIHFEPALPSLVCLIALCFLPAAARQSLTHWRALQAFDHQQLPIEKQPKPSPIYQRLIQFSLLSFFAFEIAVLATSNHDWKNTKWPIFAKFRHAAPALFALLFVSLAIQLILHSLESRIITVKRQYNEQMKANISNISRVSKRQLVFEAYRPLVNAIQSFGFSVSLVLFAKASPHPQYALRLLSILSGLILFTPSIFNNVNLGITVNNHISFRGLVILPFFVYGFFLALVFLTVVIIFCVFFVLGEAKDAFGKVFSSSNSSSSSSNKASSNSDWGFNKGPYDLESMQMLSLIYSYTWTLSLFLSSAFVCLVYRFDASQAGQSKVTLEEAQQIIQQSLHLKDKSIDLKAATLPRIALSNKQLPTYIAAIRSLFIIQITGLAFDALTGWQKASIYPVDKSQLPMNDVFSVNVWPLLCYPLIVIATLISARLESDSKLKSLWTYHEKWHLQVDPSIVNEETSKDLKEVEEQV